MISGRSYVQRGPSRKSDLMRFFQVGRGPEATPFTSSALQIAILFCKIVRMRTCMLHSVIGVGDSIKQLNMFVGKMWVRKKQKAQSCL